MRVVPNSKTLRLRQTFNKHLRQAFADSGLDVSKIDKILADHQKFAVSGLPLI